MRYKGKMRWTIEVSLGCEAMDEKEALEKMRDWGQDPKTLIGIRKEKEAEYHEHRTIYGIVPDKKPTKAKA